MAHEIVVSPLARQDIIDIADYICEKSSRDQAARWKNGLLAAIRSLAEMPKRCPMADESDELGIELRELHHHPFRIIFFVNDDLARIDILRIYHNVRAPLKIEDLQ